MAGNAREPEDVIELPKLREDLTILKGASDVGGWIIVDPIRHAYFRISQSIFDVLSVWSKGTVKGAQAAFINRFQKQLSVDEVEEISNFLCVNELTTEPKEGGWRSYASLAKAREKSVLSRGLHSYLFFRIPLLRPQRFLDFSFPFVAWLFTRGFAVFWLLLGVVSIFLVTRQWDVFLTTFASFLTWRGAFIYGVMLIFVKILHELGHAFIARKYNVHVPTIGVAFIVLFPILYTDTTAAWRLTRRQRLLIDAGGILTELSLAVLATILWVFLPDGDLRSLAFVVATITWILSLAVNLNPLMRFDGYYLLSDGLGVENLQTRGFALARWRMREFLFGFREAPPENMTLRLRRGLIFHAFCTWVYRFFLFLGIALIVYHMFFKLAGIVLFAIEIAWFIAIPIWNELKEWKKRMGQMRFNFQTLRSAAMVFSLLGLLLFPWQRSVSVPAVYSASEMVQLFPQGAGQIAHLNAREGQAVREGEVLAELEDRALNAQIQRVKMQISLLALRLARSGSDVQDLSFRTVLESEMASRGQELNALQKRQQNLSLRAPSSGVLSNVLFNLDFGDYISNRTRLGILAKTDIGEIRAYVPSEIVQRIKSGAQAKFIAEEPEIATVSLAIGDLAPPIADDPYMQIQFDVFGGDIETQPSKNGGEMVSKIPRYQVSFVSDKALPAPAYEMRGTVHIDAEPESLGRRIYRQVVGVLVRESGF